MTSQTQMQIGKNKLTKEFLDEIKKRFADSKIKNIKLSVLKSARESREDIKKFAEEIVNFLGKKFTYKILGFSIFFKKWRKVRE